MLRGSAGRKGCSCLQLLVLSTPSKLGAQLTSPAANLTLVRIGLSYVFMHLCILGIFLHFSMHPTLVLGLDHTVGLAKWVRLALDMIEWKAEFELDCLHWN